jgi:hypothetical protein
MERFNCKKLNGAEDKEKYCVVINNIYVIKETLFQFKL